MMSRYLNAVLAISAIAFSDGAMAQNMSLRAHLAAEQAIDSEYQAARSNCDPLTGNAKAVCTTAALGHEKIAKAALDARDQPGMDADYGVDIARAEADYAVAHQKCNDQPANLKEVCFHESQAAQVRAISDAQTQLNTSNAIERHNTAIINAHMRAKQENEEMRREAAAHKREVRDNAKKCASSGDRKTHCEDEAKLQYDH